MEIFDDLEAEYARLDGIFAGLTDQEWQSPSAAAGWSVVDTVLHLAQTEEGASASLTGGGPASGRRMSPEMRGALSVDDAAAAWVAAERAGTDVVYPRWRAATAATVAAARAADPARRVPWVTGTLSPATLATTRLAEHWAHALDICGPLDIPYPDTARIRHIAWLGARTLPYAFAVSGEPGGPVRAELTGPDGQEWAFGDPGAESVISGDAGAFCRVGAQRLSPADSGLTTTGPHAAAALRVLRNYAA
jgi:uncharacterized protein (TIGR03084 family)